RYRRASAGPAALPTPSRPVPPTPCRPGRRGSPPPAGPPSASRAGSRTGWTRARATARSGLASPARARGARPRPRRARAGDLERVRGDVAGRDVRVDAGVHAHRPCGEAPRARQLRDDLVEHLDVQLESERGDVARLLGAEQVARPADLQVAHRDREPGAELG